MGFFKHISSLVGFMGLPRAQRQVVFYSEGPGYWAHLGHLMQCFLDSSDTPVCFFSSSEDDPGLSIEHPTGEMTVVATLDPDGNVGEAAILRTARKLMDGEIFP